MTTQYLTFFFPFFGFVHPGRYCHRELMGVAAKSPEKFAFVIASAVESEFVRLIDRSYFKLLALFQKK